MTKPFLLACLAAVSLAVAGFPAVSASETSTPTAADPGADAPKWPQDPSWQGPGPMPRHHVVRLWGVPAPYRGMTNPLPLRGSTFRQGEAIYRQHCVACHGQHGAGDGADGRRLSPPPGNLVWLSDIPEKQWDEFMVWTIAEGGTALGTAMPPYRQLLGQDEIWAVSAYIRARIPFDSRIR
ncbi:MAG TPA: cytochrome c [Novosphingobium sp.]|nr:cytochrome c [Novosphingobium sp.]